MELTTIEIDKEKLQFLLDNGVLTEQDFMVKKVEVPLYDYSKNEQWVLLSKESKKIYKELKALEFSIRNG